MNDSELMIVYEWIDSIPLSREKKNMTRDFSDGVLAAEILKHYYPKLVELHNYPSTFNTKQKLSNWNTLCIKVLKKINFSISQQEINDIFFVLLVTSKLVLLLLLVILIEDCSFKLLLISILELLAIKCLLSVSFIILLISIALSLLKPIIHPIYFYL